MSLPLISAWIISTVRPSYGLTPHECADVRSKCTWFTGRFTSTLRETTPTSRPSQMVLAM